MNSKQVIIMRKMDKGCRTGKYCAQASHASTGSLLSLGRVSLDGNSLTIPLVDPFVRDWIVGRFAKITLYVQSDEELLDIYEKACVAGLPCALIKDAGLTEFHGVPTLTAVGIGPAESSIIDLITGNLPLF